MELEHNAISFIKQNSTPKTAVSFSGGKDSLVALDISIRAGVKKAVFSDTTIEFKETVEYVKTIQKFYGIKIDIVRAPKNFFDVVQEIGFPSRRMHWCCDVFKFGPIVRYAIKNKVDAFITGLRRCESKRRSEYTSIDKNPLIPAKQVNPIISWSTENVWSYIKKYDLPINPLYKIVDRIGCWCCPYKTKKDWKILKKHFPELYEKFRVELLRYADRLNIKDKEKFVNHLGWTSWSPPISKFNGGFICSEDKAYHLIFQNEEDGDKVIGLLPILTDNFEVHENGKVIYVPTKVPKSKLRILVEKAINCVGCGGCLTTCKYGALIIENGSIKVNKNKCVHCYECLNTGLLRGACIMRNYTPRRAGVIPI